MKIIASLRRFFLPACLGALVLTMAISAQTPKEEFIPKPDALEVHGVPPIPASLAKAVAPYTAPYGYTLAGWHPEKREIRVKLLSDTPSIYRIEEPSGRQKLWKQLLVGSVYDLYFDPEEKFIIYNKDQNGNEAYQMYLYDLKTYRSTLLSDAGSRNTEFVWSNAGDRIVYCRSKEFDGPGVSLFVMDPRDIKTNRLLFKSEGNYIKAYDWSPDDRMIVVCEFYSPSDSRLWLLEVSSGRKTLLSRSVGKWEYYGWPKFSKNGNGVFVITNYKLNMKRLMYINLKTQEYSYLTSSSSKWDVDSFSISRDGRFIAFTENVDGYSKIYILDLLKNKTDMVEGLPLGIVSGVIWHRNSQDFAFNLRSTRIPNDVYSVNIDNKRATLWSKSMMNGLDPESIVQPELIEWSGFDGRKIPGILYRAPLKFTGRRPVIVYLHGGPTDQYRPEFDYEHNYYLNELGIAYIYPNYRGSSGYGKDYLHSDDGMRREAQVTDIEIVLDWIKMQSYLDPDRVMIRGGSYGGYLALSVAYKYTKRIRCVRSDSGFANLASSMLSVEASRRDLQRAEFGDERDPRYKKLMDGIAPLTNYENIKAPLFITHGQNDPMASIKEAKLIARLIAKNNVPVWTIYASNEGHSFSNKANWDFSFYAGVLFVKEYLIENRYPSK